MRLRFSNPVIQMALIVCMKISIIVVASMISKYTYIVTKTTNHRPPLERDGGSRFNKPQQKNDDDTVLMTS